jgi:hypothetical protein
MEFFKNQNIKPLTIFKMTILAVLCVSVLVFVVSLINNTVRPMANRQNKIATSAVAPSYGVAEDAIYFNGKMGGGMADLSVQNIMPVPYPQGTTGNTAEQFEVTDYSATIEARNKEEVCSQVSGLKSLSYVIFENAQESDRNCNYTFKVEKNHVAEILAKIKDLDPKDLYENTRTIKRQLDDFTSQTEILEKKLSSIDDTLKNAVAAYDQISALAARTQDVASLAKIIDSKLQVIERLTQEKINVSQQLDYLAKAKAEEMDKLAYTYFNVNIYENKYFDGENLKDSWVAAVQNFVYSVNIAVQNATINLLATLLKLLPYLVYALIIFVLAKYGWKSLKNSWNK